MHSWSGRNRETNLVLDHGEHSDVNCEAAKRPHRDDWPLVAGGRSVSWAETSAGDFDQLLPARSDCFPDRSVTTTSAWSIHLAVGIDLSDPPR